MPFEPQDIFQARQLVLSPNKQNTFGTPVASFATGYKCQFDGGAFAKISKERRSNLDLSGKGHPWATERQEIARQTAFDWSGELTDFLAGWLCYFGFAKVVTTGAGPFTHTFTFENATNQAPVTSIYMQDTADIKTTYPDMAMAELEFSGTDKGPLMFSTSLVGSGRFTDGAVAAADSLALPTNVYLLGSDTDILFGPQAGSTSIKERIRQWSVKLSIPITHHRAPGGGLYSTFAKMGPQRVTANLAIAAKDTDDIRTLYVGETVRELKINTTTSGKQLNLTLPQVIVGDASYSADGNEIVYQMSFDESGIQKGGALNEVLQAVVINAQATYGVGA
jgi:hypothetical protein